MIHMFSMVISEDLSHERKESYWNGEEELHRVGVSLGPVGQAECHSLEIQVQHVCTCYFVALMTCFLIGLISLKFGA